MQVSYEMVQKEENEWHVIFKIVTSNNSKMILLANPSGNITDYNLASLHLLRQFFSDDKQLKQNLNLTDLGIKAQSSKFLKQNGSLVVLNVSNQERECLAHVEPIHAAVCRDEER